MAHSEDRQDCPENNFAYLREVICNAAHLLPAQGPITTFVHHNPLHLFENKLFHPSLIEAGQIFGTQMYLSEERYHQELSKGRILFSDVEKILKTLLGSSANDIIIEQSSRFDICLSMLRNLPVTASENESKWFIANSKRLDKLVRPGASDDKKHLNLMLEHCLFGIAQVEINHATSEPERFRDLILEVTGQDTDLLVNELLIRFCGAFLDQGFAIWELPYRKEGFIFAFRNFCISNPSLLGAWAKNLPDILKQTSQANFNPLDLIQDSLLILGIDKKDWEPFITQSLLAIRGWAGMIHQIVTRPDKVPHPVASDCLTEFLAIRLLLDRLAIKKVLKEYSFTYATKDTLKHELRKLKESRVKKPDLISPGLEAFSLAMDLKWDKNIRFFSSSDWTKIALEIESFSNMERRRVFHLAYEKSLYRQALDSILTRPALQSAEPPTYQAVFCLDEREESLRRHLEEVDPFFETLGIAGFFNTPMYFKGEHESFYTPLCPIIITPAHWVEEIPEEEFIKAYRSQATVIRTMQMASHRLHIGSRGSFWGVFLSAGVGILTSIPMALTILFPRLSAKIKNYFAPLNSNTHTTKLKLERFNETPGPGENHIGFSLSEMATMAERFLRDIGLTNNFCKLIFIFGHGSTSVNNPHQSAYDCGACGGSPGGANARALSQILNDKRVRAILFNNGISIPDETFFLGGLSNTSKNHVSFFDKQLLPQSHSLTFEKAKASLYAACKRNAHERCRRFYSAPLDISLDDAHRHVEGRTADLAQPRPELGHATNAFCIVGRRQRTKGIFLDRRAFLVSYDPTQDNDNNDILNRILNAAMPVCSGINLEFFFSQIDPTGWGCGTKLPHNPTSFLGVMDGAASDLRTGLPWQVVEIHEAVRLLFLIETTAEIMLKILDRCPPLANLCYNGWINLAILDPESAKAQILKGKTFVPYHLSENKVPTSPSSFDWYQGKREHLDYPHISGNQVSKSFTEKAYS